MIPDDAASGDAGLPKENNSIGVRLPQNKKACSAELYRFQRRHFQIFDFFMFGLALSKQADEARAAIAGALEALDDDTMRAEKLRSNPNASFHKLRSFSHHQSEVMVIRCVDNFMSYLSEILQTCMAKKPELLKSKEQVKTEDVLRFTNRHELIEFLINRKLNELTYGGLRAIEEFLELRLGLKLLETQRDRATLSVAIELRNIYTHNRGVVNELFLSRLSEQPHKHKFILGKRFHAEFDNIVDFANVQFDIAPKLDDRVVEKFGLLKKRYSTWDAPRIEREKRLDDEAHPEKKSEDQEDD